MRPLLFLLVLAVAACGDRSYEGSEVPPPDTAGGRPDLSRPDAGTRLLVTLTDTAMAFSHDSIQMVGTGQTTFAVENEGTEPKVFKIDGKELGQWTSPPIGPGETIFMSMLLGRGSYEMLWPEDGSGQKRTFKVY